MATVNMIPVALDNLKNVKLVEMKEKVAEYTHRIATAHPGCVGTVAASVVNPLGIASKNVDSLIGFIDMLETWYKCNAKEPYAADSLESLIKSVSESCISLRRDPQDGLFPKTGIQAEQHKWEALSREYMNRVVFEIFQLLNTTYPYLSNLIY